MLGLVLHVLSWDRNNHVFVESRKQQDVVKRQITEMDGVVVRFVVILCHVEFILVLDHVMKVFVDHVKLLSMLNAIVVRKSLR